MSSDPEATVRQTVKQLGLTYPVLSDESRDFIRAYGVLHPQEGIARPSVFIVDREGKIACQYIGKTASDRPPTATILAELKAMR